MRPLWLDILSTALPLVAGSLAFLAGRWAGRLHRPALIGAVSPAVFVVLTAWPAHLWLEDWIGPRLADVGGELTPALWAGLFLLGVVAVLPNRTLSRGFMISTLAIVGTLLIAQGSGRLIWRFAAPGMWEHQVDRSGCLRQSLGITCAPASAVMLLHRHGIATSEGEMAYLANTGLGTNFYSMADAVAIKVKDTGYTARVETLSYDHCVQQGDAFIAAVRMPRIGSHAILVEAVTREDVVMVDPLAGHPRHVAREEFEQWWHGKVIRIVKDE
jgi:hypothetical protein